MADRVIVVGARRGGHRVPASEIRQMVGRAGRKHHEEVCHADVVLDEKDYDDVVKEMSDDDSLVIDSTLTDYKSVIFHLLPEICHGQVCDVESAERWHTSSFAHFQGKTFNAESSLSALESVGAIKKRDGKYVSSVMGDIAASLYLHPSDVLAWKANFDELFNSGMECDDVAVAWALGNVPMMRVTGDFGNHWEAVTECRDRMPPGFDIADGCLTTIALWWSITGGLPVGKMKSASLALRADFGRVKSALVRLDKKIAEWGMDDFFEELGMRVRRGLPSKLVPLCKIEGMTKSLADYLYNMGVESRFDIPKVIQNLEGELEDKYMQILKEAVSGIR